MKLTFAFDSIKKLFEGSSMTADSVRDLTKFGSLGKSGVVKETMKEIEALIKTSSYNRSTSCIYRISKTENEEALSEVIKGLTGQGFKLTRSKLNDIFPEQLKEDETDLLFISWA